METPRRLGPPDTGQVIETSNVIGGVLNVILDETIEKMDTTSSHNYNQHTFVKRPGDKILYNSQTKYQVIDSASHNINYAHSSQQNNGDVTNRTPQTFTKNTTYINNNKIYVG